MEISLSHAGMIIHCGYNTTLWLLVALLLLTLMGKAYTPASTVHLVKTSGWSVETISLPDEQAVYLLFWMEGPGGKEPKGGRATDPGDENSPLRRERQEEEEDQEERIKVLEEEEEDEGPLVQLKEEDEEEQERLTQEEEKEEEVVLFKTGKEEEKATVHEGKEAEKALVQGGIEEEEGSRAGRRGKEEENIVNLSYFVSSFQYPPLTFPLPRRNVWYAAHFDYHRVSIPVADVIRHPVPSSWWGRTVKVSSGPTVYWYLCISSEPCEPGSPTSLLQDTDTKPTASTDPSGVRGVDRVLVVVLGAACGVLLPACLSLLAMVITLRRRRHSQATPRYPPHSCSCRTSPQRRYSERL